MRHVIVIGGGFAGAAAASALAEQGLPVTLIEQRATLGGRTFSLRDGTIGDEVDNGQHLFLGCYRDTIDFLRRLGVEERLKFFPKLRIPFYQNEGRVHTLRSALFPGAAGFVFGFLGFGALRLGERLSVIRALTGFRCRRREDITGLTVSQWLTRKKQSSGARHAFWTPLCLATLNEHPDRASFAALAVVLREGFLRKSADMRLGYSALSLSKLWPMELPGYLKAREGVVSYRQAVTGFKVENDRVRMILLQSGETVEADAVVCAVPLASFARICPPEIKDYYRGLDPASHSAILSVNLWFDSPLFAEPFAGLLDGHFHWIFNRHRLWSGKASTPGYVSLVMSGANPTGRGPDFTKMANEEIIHFALKDLKKCFPTADKKNLKHASVLWERQATPSPTPDFWKSRPKAETALRNLFLAGDWVDVGLPPTIEAACRSGHRAAALAHQFMQNHILQETPC